MTNESNPPCLRSRRRIILKSITALILAFIAYRVIWWATGTPAPHVDYLAKAQELAASNQPAEGENGWPLLVEAAEMMEKVNEEVADLLAERFEAYPAFATWYERPGEVGDLFYDFINEEPFDREFTKPEAGALVHLHTQGFFALIDRAAAAPRLLEPLDYDPEDDSLMANVMLDDILQIKSLFQVCVAAMRLAAEDHEFSLCAKSFERIMFLGRASARQYSLIHRLVAMSIAIGALRELNNELIIYDFNEESLLRFSRALESFNDWPPPSLCLETERLNGLDMIQHSFSDDGHGDGSLRSSFQDVENAFSTGDTLQDLLGGLLHAGRHAATNQLNEFYDEVITHCALTPPEKFGSSFDPVQYVENLSPRQYLLKIYLPAIGAVLDNMDNQHTYLAATRFLIALKIHEVRHGSWPLALDDLVPGVLEQPILDPANDLPFIYRLIDDGSGKSRVILYSMGVDGEDDSAGIDFSDPLAVSGMGHNIWVEGTDVLLTRPRAESTLRELLKE